ncbi:MAG TPA: hypothetical protein VNJ06_12530 [Gemmatimonadales bacterium]|nr:hypothetical protein [Gemmatimonadales bacterium]
MKLSWVVAAALAVQPLAAQTRVAAPNPRARLFVARGCSECHAIDPLKVKARTDVGPELSSAYVDVPTRYGVTLERFFDEPLGIMRLILAEHVQLGRTDSDSLVRLFRDLYAEHLARLDSLNRRARPARGPPRAADLRRRS